MSIPRGLLYASLSPFLAILWLLGLRNRCFIKILYLSLIALGAGYAIKPMTPLRIAIWLTASMGLRSPTYMGLFIGLMLYA